MLTPQLIDTILKGCLADDGGTYNDPEIGATVEGFMDVVIKSNIFKKFRKEIAAEAPIEVAVLAAMAAGYAIGLAATTNVKEKENVG